MPIKSCSGYLLFGLHTPPSVALLTQHETNTPQPNLTFICMPGGAALATDSEVAAGASSPYESS